LNVYNSPDLAIACALSANEICVSKHEKMKKLSLVLFATIISLTLILPGCKKSGGGTSAPGPALAVLREGFLSTKSGYFYGGGIGDTVYVRSHLSSYTIAGTTKGGTPEDKKYYWYIEDAGTPTVWYIRSKTYGYYLGFRKAPVYPGYYDWAVTWITLDTIPGARNRFIANKIGDNNFYVQSFDDNTLYMNTTNSPQISYTGPVRPSSLFFLPKKQEFFFMKPF
jgi:hypothetical protein